MRLSETKNALSRENCSLENEFVLDAFCSRHFHEQLIPQHAHVDAIGVALPMMIFVFRQLRRDELSSCNSCHLRTSKTLLLY
jgi:hypothetical protein